MLKKQLLQDFIKVKTDSLYLRRNSNDECIYYSLFSDENNNSTVFIRLVETSQEV